MEELDLHRTTQLLRRMSGGDLVAQDELMAAVYDELREVAQRALRGGAGETLQATALVHEAWIKLARVEGVAWEGRKHYVCTAASAMRSILVDHFRARRALKRGGGGERIGLDESLAAIERDSEICLGVHEALEELLPVDERLARIAELRCFGGLTQEEIAGVLDVSVRTVERGWKTARAYLQRALERGGAGA